MGRTLTHPALRLSLRGLSKTFGPVKVLDDVQLSVAPGEIHGLAGQNGSGKSTLIKILTGVYTPDTGAHLSVDGAEVRMPVRWNEVRAAGISVVHQDLGLIDHLTVAENVCVGGFPTARGGRIDRRERDRLTARTLERLGIDLEPDALVAGLGAPERAEIAIARALRDHAPGKGLMILDESTRALNGEELERIHAMLRRIVAEGASAILISHSLPELKAVTQRVTVLRDGRVAAAGLETDDLDEHDIARAMLGSSFDIAASSRAAQDRVERGRPVLRVRGVSGTNLRHVDLEVAAGEIVGITGLPGSGHEELPYLLAGAIPGAVGGVEVDGHELGHDAGIQDRLAAGLALVPERRDRDGLALDLSVQDNLCMPRLRHHGSAGFVGRGWQADQTWHAIRELGIRPADPRALVKQLSGGNQQKVLLAKWLTGNPKVLVLHEPTQAVDVGARKDILRRLVRAAADGTAVVVVSSEVDDLTEICDRVLVHQSRGGLRPGSADDPDLLVQQIYAAQQPTGASA
ncbi:sugar ABC transporter ATP-binding protein [Nocardioides currus]|uniref:sugar ABC transporter ATP-binding protein n=1 Tax=Nocardioides currus TaxID=2133958 RepID=UPI001A9C5188|nr:sugar ABC transporter ATP-binding protein [Nocardioides currus]